MRADGVASTVTFAKPPVDAHPDVDLAYHVEYDRRGATIVGHVVGPTAQLTTMRLSVEGGRRP
ncbi:MAG: hypothetical protein HIU84_06815 [Acidobacteria bacterium]|nr:hypothetical protein [Acidobacteriota bacterium]